MNAGQTQDAASPVVDSAARFAAEARAHAAGWDRDGALPASVCKEVAAAGLLAPDLPGAYGGSGLTPLQLGEMCAHLGGVCSAVRGLVTVQGMVAAALNRWGTREQRAQWLPSLASGELIAGFAATEEGAGSALSEVGTGITDSGDGEHVSVTGRKRWITFGQVAQVFLVLGKHEGKPAAVIVEADRAGVSREPVGGQLGMRAAQIAHVTFEGVRVPRSHLVAPAGLGLSHVAAAALDHGRFTVAWGCVGMAEACVEDARHTPPAGCRAAPRSPTTSPSARCSRGSPWRPRARVNSPAAPPSSAPAEHSAVCRRRSSPSTRRPQPRHRRAGTPCRSSARPAASRTAGRGAIFRDAKVMEIIEGAQQVAEVHIAEQLLRRHAAPATAVRGGGVPA